MTQSRLQLVWLVMSGQLHNSFEVHQVRFFRMKKIKKSLQSFFLNSESVIRREERYALHFFLKITYNLPFTP